MSRVPLTDEMHAKILELENLTGMGPFAVVNNWPDKPAGITGGMVWQWAQRGHIKTVDSGLYNAVIAHWASLGKAIPITAKMRKALIAERKRVGIGPGPLLKYTDETPPAGLNIHAIQRWMNGEAKTVNQRQFDFVMRAYAHLTPDAIYHKRYLSAPDTIILTDDMRAHLQILRDKSGVGPMKLMRLRPDRPKGLTSSHILNWLNGTVKTASKQHFEFVKAAWRDARAEIAVTPSMVKTMRKEFERTGVSTQQLINLCPNLGGQIKSQTIYILKSGRRRFIEENVWEMMMDALRALPDQSSPPTKQAYIGRGPTSNAVYAAPNTTRADAPQKQASTYAPASSRKRAILSNLPDDLELLHDKDRSALVKHRERTGVGATSLLKQFADEKPEKLSANMISSWINGPSKYASKSLRQWVLSKWKSLPNKS